MLKKNSTKKYSYKISMFLLPISKYVVRVLVSSNILLKSLRKWILDIKMIQNLCQELLNTLIPYF